MDECTFVLNMSCNIFKFNQFYFPPKVLPNSCTPLWPKDDSDLMLVARVLGQCTPAFKYSEAQCTLLKLPGNKVILTRTQK